MSRIIQKFERSEFAEESEWGIGHDYHDIIDRCIMGRRSVACDTCEAPCIEYERTVMGIGVEMGRTDTAHDYRNLMIVNILYSRC